MKRQKDIHPLHGRAHLLTSDEVTQNTCAWAKITHFSINSLSSPLSEGDSTEISQILMAMGLPPSLDSENCLLYL